MAKQSLRDGEQEASDSFVLEGGLRRLGFLCARGVIWSCCRVVVCCDDVGVLWLVCQFRNDVHQQINFFLAVRRGALDGA